MRFNVERFRRDGGALRRARPGEVRAFCETICQEDLLEAEIAFGVPRGRLADDNLEDGNGLKLGFWILSFRGEDCVLLGLRKDIDVPTGVWVWSLTSTALERHWRAYGRWARDALATCVKLTAPWADEVRTVIWERHRVRGMVRRVLGGAFLGVIEGTELGVYRLRGIEDDVRLMGGDDNGGGN